MLNRRVGDNNNMLGIAVGTVRCLLRVDSLGIATAHLVGIVPPDASEFVGAAVLRRLRELHPVAVIYRLEKAAGLTPQLLGVLVGLRSGRMADGPAACVGTDEQLPMLRAATRAAIAEGLMRRSFSCPRVAAAWIAEEVELVRSSGTCAPDRREGLAPRQSPPALRPSRTD